MSRACLCVLCGLPGAGKSRLAEVLRGHARSRGWETLLVTYDELIEARDWREDEWKQQRKTVLTCLERFLHQTHTHTDLTHTHTDHTHTDLTHTHTDITQTDLTHTHTDLTHTHTDITQTDLTHTHTDLTHTHTDLTHTHTDHTHTDLTHTHTDLTHTDITQTDLMHTHTDFTHTHTDNDMWMQMQVQQSRSHTHTQPLLVLLDDNFYYQSMRYQIYQLARKCMCSSVSDIIKFHINVSDMYVFHMRKDSTGFCQVLVQCALEVCLQRNQCRTLCVPEEVMLQMSERMEPPNKSRNSWEQKSLTVDSTHSVTDEDVQTLMDLLQSAMENPLRPFQDDSQQKEADRQICATNVLHQADQMCRRLISQAMTSAREKQASSDVLKVLAKELNELKTHFLQELQKEIFHQMSLCPEEPMNTEKLLMTAARVFEGDTQHCVQAQLKQRFT